ncbi:hypothetical protein OIE69_37815 [Actinacidiphila glaucinigra]|uniref:hypothetical protein n=1 Tax=Actinacidiphila glaucinigra TaxID=235986 RepID=UPI002DDA946F|nr:hypothetical protein [Actinacidiphila glaucinigra]WSD64240.1 hypothetical protein OIE69_37815 [Actinacidiphila glaucinigra]
MRSDGGAGRGGAIPARLSGVVLVLCGLLAALGICGHAGPPQDAYGPVRTLVSSHLAYVADEICTDAHDPGGRGNGCSPAEHTPVTLGSAPLPHLPGAEPPSVWPPAVAAAGLGAPSPGIVRSLDLHMLQIQRT